MKKKIINLLVILGIGIIFSDCIRNNGIGPLVITGKLINSSTCKSNFKSSSIVEVTTDSISCITYSFDMDKAKLTLKHINAGFNCCPDSLYSKVEVFGDTIQIQEFEKKVQCRCNCLYDLDLELEGVEPGKYIIKFVEPYASGQKQLVFAVDLINYKTGSYCVTRKQYPWGMTSVH